jgi:ribonuclease T2
MQVRTAFRMLILGLAAVSVAASPAEARHKRHKHSTYEASPEELNEEPASSERVAPPAPPPGGEYAARTGARNVAGEFDYYALVLSWSPSFCAEGTHSDSPQCSDNAPRPYNFVLHGLWPQYGKGWPQDCAVGQRPYVEDRLINQMLDIMPAKKLIIHEYSKHGTCSGLSPDGYFSLARKLYTSIKLPERFQSPGAWQTVTPDEVVADFIKINPQIKPDMIAVSCGGSGNQLKEVHICMSPGGQPTACGRNENKKKMCSENEMAVPPVRGATGTRSGWNAGEPAASAPPPKQTLTGAILQYFGKK